MTEAFKSYNMCQEGGGAVCGEGMHLHDDLDDHEDAIPFITHCTTFFPAR